MYRILIALVLLSNSLLAQRLNKADKAVVKYLQQQVGYLASDELKGRRAGDPGEILAAQFIGSKFKEIGLVPRGTDGNYFQPFSINDGKKLSKEGFLMVNGFLLEPLTDYFPLSNSSPIVFQSECSQSLNEKGQPWLVDIADIITENKDNPHFDFSNMLDEKINLFKSKGATAVIFFNSGTIPDNIVFDGKDRSAPLGLPALYISPKAQKRIFSDASASYQIDAKVSIVLKSREARNVVGFIDNKAQFTVVIGAHFDHLGYGEDGNSMIRSGDMGIHNGADDNASGTAAMIELAFLLKSSKSKRFNYLFIAFSAEELGLNGSKYFVENPTVSLNNINFMINMDMVGRMNDSTKSITVGGYGTSPAWNSILASVKKKSFSIKFDSSGSGPSDHTSFYRKDIPVLFFFTGLHSDYHKPTDDADKINYVGMLHIIRFIHQMIEGIKSPEKLAFTKTREQQTSTSARFSVSMGIMPDYTFSGNGVRVDGVSDNRPAKKAGILTGDIVKQLGDFKTSSVESYMQALSKFKKGDKTVVILLRGDREIQFEIQFQ